MLTRLLQLFSPKDLSPEVTRELWELRLRHFALKPEIDPEADWEKFRTFAEHSTYAWILRVPGGPKPVGFFFVRYRSARVQEEDVFFIQYEYLFIDRPYRKTPLANFAMVFCLFGGLTRAKGRKCYVGGVTYPGGYLQIAQTYDQVWLRAEDPKNALDRAVFLHFMKELTPKNASPISMPTLPQEKNPKTENPTIRRAMRRYLQVCPNWAEGNALFCVAPANGKMAEMALRRLPVRAIQKFKLILGNFKAS